MFTVAVSPGLGNATATRSKMPGLLLDDVLGRARRDRPDVHPGHEHRDERDPPQLLEERQEPEADERVAGELRDVRRGARRRASERTSASGARNRGGDSEERAPSSSEREREPDRGGERRGRRATAVEDDVEARREPGQLPPRPRRTRRGRRATRRRALPTRRAAQIRRLLRPPGAERLEGVPEARSSQARRRATRRCPA